ncbi:MarR family winged helix-turn-helix transcriptional regulator [Streptomyces sp. CL12-4]|uniref:MarR family winged helix-turn-helix transcriptional regulator n=1 Tax=Streptomyces sp. CL12-4 TaxID=2810306 RepID=UPI001EFBCA32|nr:MarR family transcriptional regulator [Streptomyces sp. CL12-4]MCG8970253.1 MarR family transcriptional regulator [Streptomyces sp. CL12-4]
MESGVLEGENLVVWREFLRWSQSIHAAVNKAVAEAADLSVSEFEVLTRLWSEPDHVLPQLELATALNWSASRASHLLHRLGQRSFVTREDSGQGRARVVRLTEEGHRHLLGAFEAHGRAFRAMLLDRLSAEQRATLLAIMTEGPDRAAGS